MAVLTSAVLTDRAENLGDSRSGVIAHQIELLGTTRCAPQGDTLSLQDPTAHTSPAPPGGVRTTALVQGSACF